MSKKNLFITAALLVAIAAFVQIYTKRNRHRGDSPVGKPLASVDLVEKIDTITISKGETSIQLQKNADRWSIAEKEMFPVNMEKLLNLLDNITSYRIASVVTNDQTRLPDFKLTEAEGGTTVSLTADDNAVFKMIVGKSRTPPSTSNSRPPRPDGTYIKIGDTGTVFLIKENFEIETDINTWMEKVLFTMDKTRIKSLRIESSSSRLLFERKDKTSSLTLSDLHDGETPQQQPVSNLMDELESFEISDALPLGSSLEKELHLKAEIVVSLFDNSSLDFQILAKSEKNPLADKKETKKEEVVYYVRLVDVQPAEQNKIWNQPAELGQKWLFEIDDWRAENWLKNRKDFIKTDKKP